MGDRDGRLNMGERGFIPITFLTAVNDLFPEVIVRCHRFHLRYGTVWAGVDKKRVRKGGR